jgi:hypothetical protein
LLLTSPSISITHDQTSTVSLSATTYSRICWQTVRRSLQTPRRENSFTSAIGVIAVGSNDWNVDLILGPPPSNFPTPATTDPIVKAVPATIRIAIEAKTIMTEHGKARRNRQRDLDSFHQFARRYDASTVTAALTVVNVATTFKSPLRQVITAHRNIQALAQGTIGILRSIQLRSSLDQPGLDANTVILVEHDNVDSTKTALVLAAPAPQTGDPLHYESFLHRTCDRYAQRWP